jgi:hypothetical protein
MQGSPPRSHSGKRRYNTEHHISEKVSLIAFFLVVLVLRENIHVKMLLGR